MKTTKLFNLLFIVIMVFSLGSCVPCGEVITKGHEDWNAAVTIPVKGNAANTKTTEIEKIYKNVNKCLNEKYADVAKNNLLGTAFTLRSLCEHELGMYNEAANSADSAVAAMGVSATDVKSRDYALMTAMPGMIKNSELFDKLPTSPITEAEYLKIKNLAEGALEDLAKGRNAVGESHEIQKYLIEYQLATTLNWADALEFTQAPSDEDLNRKRTRRTELLIKAKDYLKELEEKGVDAARITFWKNILGTV